MLFLVTNGLKNLMLILKMFVNFFLKQMCSSCFFQPSVNSKYDESYEPA